MDDKIGKKGGDVWNAKRDGMLLAIESASPHEVTRVDETLAACFVDDQLERVIGDRPMLATT